MNSHTKVPSAGRGAFAALAICAALLLLFTTPGFAADDLAIQDIAVDGTVSGSYLDTQSSDNVYEAIEEVESNGSPSKRYSYLEHKWTISVTGGSTVTFSVEAYHTANTEGDNFVFAYSTDDTNYTDMVTVTKTADDDTPQTYALPSGLSGTVYVRVTDLDQTQGNSSLDTIYVDNLFIESTGQSPTPTPTATPTPSPTPSPTPGPAPDRLGGGFMSMRGAASKFTDAQWNEELGTMHSLGMDTLVFIDVILTQDNTCYYPNSAYYTKLATGSPDPIETVLTYADANNMKVLLGLGQNDDWWSGSNNTNSTWLSGEATKNMNSIDDLYALYGSHPSLWGWYIANELDDLTWDSASYKTTLIDDYIVPVSSYAKANSSPNLLVTQAPFFGGNLSTTDYETWWDDYFSRCPDVDLEMLQDGVGVRRWTDPVNQVPPYYQALRNAADQYGRTLYSDIEIFKQIHGWPVDANPWQAIPGRMVDTSGDVDAALQAPYTANPPFRTDWLADTGQLTDGFNYWDWNYVTGWAENQITTTAQVVVDLGTESSTIFKAYADVFISDSSAVGPPSSVAVYGSSTSDTGPWTLWGNATTTDRGTEAIRRYTWQGSDQTARWVLFEFTPADPADHFLLSELNVIDGTVTDPSPDDYPGIKTQINMEKDYVDKFICFDYAFYMSQNQGGTSPGNVDLYNDYVNYLNQLTYPQVAIDSPANGANVSGSVPISATITDDGTVTAADYQVDGGAWNTMTNTSGNTWEATWDSTSVSEGSHTITVRGTDNDSNEGFANVGVNVANNANTIHVQNIQMTATSQGSGSKTKYGGGAGATIVDQNLNPVTGASVTFTWTGASPYVETIQTGADGVAWSYTPKIAGGGTFIVTITDVQLNGYLYVPGDNVETTDQITNP